MNLIAKILGILFPPRFPSLDARHAIAELPADADPMNVEVTECGILWRAYDVRKTGIEKHIAEERTTDEK